MMEFDEFRTIGSNQLTLVLTKEESEIPKIFNENLVQINGTYKESDWNVENLKKIVEEPESLPLRDYDFSQHRFGGCQIDPEFQGSLILINKRRKKVGEPEIVINRNDSELRPELNRLNPLDKEYAIYLFDNKEINKLNFITFCLRKLL